MHLCMIFILSMWRQLHVTEYLRILFRAKSPPSLSVEILFLPHVIFAGPEDKKLFA